MELNKPGEEGQEELSTRKAMADSCDQGLVDHHAASKKPKLGESKHSSTISRPDSEAARHAVFWSAFSRKRIPISNPTSRTTGMLVRCEPSLPMQDSKLETQQERIYDKRAKEVDKCQAKEALQGCDASSLSITFKGEQTCKPSENTGQCSPLKDGSGPLPSWDDNIIQAKEVLSGWRNCNSSASCSTGLTGANYEERLISTTPISGFEAFYQLAKLDAERSLLRENHLHTAPASTLGESSIKPSSSINDHSMIQVSLTLESIYQEKQLLLGAVFDSMASESLEFYFLNAMDMAVCTGVGLPHAKVTLHNDLSITIQELLENEGELEKILSSMETHHLVMKVKMDDTRAQQSGVVHVPRCVTEEGETLSRLVGVGFHGGAQYVDETYHKRVVSWPLLYDVAHFVLTHTSEFLSNTYTFGASSAQGGSMVHTLCRKRDFLQKHGNLKERGDGGDEDGFDCTHNGLEDDDDPPMVLKVTVYPRSKCDILDTLVKPYGLDGASIAPKLVFEFHQNRESKRIFIKALTRLELASESDVLNNVDLFGWYHTEIQISFGCEDTQGHPQSGRVAILRQNSCKLSNPIIFNKYTVANSRLSSTANMFGVGVQATAKLNASLMGGIELQSSSGGSRMKEEGISKCEDIEMVHENVCKGFSFRDSSSTESPARANFFLTYPLENFNIWDNREFLQNQGLFSTIEPCIEGSWIPLNGLDASPYLFKVKRSLKLQRRGNKLTNHVIEHKQEYVLPFYVNHAMTHLRIQKSKHIELNGDQQSVPNVLKVGSVY